MKKMEELDFEPDDMMDMFGHIVKLVALGLEKNNEK